MSEAASHTLTLYICINPSPLPVAKNLPSGLKLMAYTARLLSRKTAQLRPVLATHKRAVPSKEELFAHQSDKLKTKGQDTYVAWSSGTPSTRAGCHVIVLTPFSWPSSTTDLRSVIPRPGKSSPAGEDALISEISHTRAVRSSEHVASFVPSRLALI